MINKVIINSHFDSLTITILILRTLLFQLKPKANELRKFTTPRLEILNEMDTYQH